ncbi:hypothetical protein IW146_008654 [Coemansia sp. RSA 922]|nr:hypothetical protein IW146_008654 [Coemansia sp. RSA 922]
MLTAACDPAPFATSSNDKWTVSALYTYPIKSCQPTSLSSSLVSETGLLYDRLWILTDAKSGRFVTQRQVPQLALIKVSIDTKSSTLELSAPSMPTTLQLPLHPQPGVDLGEQYKVRIWYDDVYGRCCGEAAQAWLTTFVGKPIRLLYKDSAETRLVSRYLPDDETCHLPPQSGFADVFPFHIITDTSLDHVNQHVPLPLTHHHFRPNIVLSATNSDAPPYDEETWKRIEFDSSEDKTWSMFVTSRTPRCTMPNVDLSTGTMRSDGEPIKSLRKFRCTDPGKPTYVCFGMQATPQHAGQVIRLGQVVTVRERGFHSLTQPL